MKVTFSGHFNEVIRQVNAPLMRQDEGAHRFSQILGDLEPTPKNGAIGDKITNEQISKLDFDSGDNMARFDFKSYALEQPKSLERMGEGDALPGVKILPGDMKPPHMISATRVPSSGLSASQYPKPEIASMINKSGLQEGVDPKLALAVAHSESSFNPNAVSTDGHASKGLFQLLDSTGKQLHSKLEIDGRYDPFNAKMNTTLGVNYLKYLTDIFSKNTDLPNNTSTIAGAKVSDVEKLAVAAFNAGEGRVASAQTRAQKQGVDPTKYSSVSPFLPDSTQEYVERVFKYRESYIDGETADS